MVKLKRNTKNSGTRFYHTFARLAFPTGRLPIPGEDWLHLTLVGALFVLSSPKTPARFLLTNTGWKRSSGGADSICSRNRKSKLSSFSPHYF